MKNSKTIFSDTHKQHLSDAAKGKSKSPEHRAKIAETARKRWQEKKLSKTVASNKE